MVLRKVKGVHNKNEILFIVQSCSKCISDKKINKNWTGCSQSKPHHNNDFFRSSFVLSYPAVGYLTKICINRPVWVPRFHTHLPHFFTSTPQSSFGQNWVIEWANLGFSDRIIGLTVKQLIETQASQSSAKASSFVYVFKPGSCPLVVVEHVATKFRNKLIFMFLFSFYGKA